MPSNTGLMSLLGSHPPPPHIFAEILSADDGTTDSKVEARVLSEVKGQRDNAARAFRDMLIRHHVSPAMAERNARRAEAMRGLDLDAAQARVKRFPRNSATQKGNLAEVVMAEYIEAARKIRIPIYRLRYNPNVDQSMKGDDLLAFDFESKPVTIVVGEAKYRAQSSAAVVKEIVECLVRSQKAGIPVSLQFVADRLYEAGERVLADRIADCSRLIALGEAQIDYVGLLLSDADGPKRVKSATPAALKRLAVLTLGIEKPDEIVAACYTGLE